MAHTIVKPQKLALTAVGMLEQELVLPNLFLKESIDKYKGAENDSVSVKVGGVLPFHDYGWRNDRSSPITFDEYSERKITVSFGGNVYSAIKLTDEQNDFDIKQWADLLRPQAKAVSRGLQRRAVNAVTSATYNVTIGLQDQIGTAGVLKSAIIEARRVLNAFNVPAENRVMVVGTDFESALLNDDKLNLASNVGDAEAESALRTATIGNKFGFRFVVDQTIPAGDAYAMVPAAFVFLSGAPAVPTSVPFGATTSFEGIALRWVRDYDPTFMQDRSVVNTYAGFRDVTDVLVGWDSVNEKEVVSTNEYLVRAIRLRTGVGSDYPAAASELATITGISDAKVWTPTGYALETDAANI